MSFFYEDEPVRSQPLPVLPDIWRIVAPNPSVKSYHGTNTYLIKCADGYYVFDPGPDSQEHVEAIVQAVDSEAVGIVVTHAHEDHIGAASALQARLQVPIHAFAKRTYSNFVPDIALEPDSLIAGFRTIHTPGHAPDHLCFERFDGLVLTGDHVMGWSSTVVSPPHGDMAAYFRSLETLMTRPGQIYLPGHGPALNDPIPFVGALLEKRRARESSILTLLKSEPISAEDIASRLYKKNNQFLRLLAQRNVLAHLVKLSAEGKARAYDSDRWIA